LNMEFLKFCTIRYIEPSTSITFSKQRGGGGEGVTSVTL
jgi:hypothetical protein